MKYDEFATEILRLYPEFKYAARDEGHAELCLFVAKPHMEGCHWMPDPSNAMMNVIELPKGLTDNPAWTESLRYEVPEVRAEAVTRDGLRWIIPGCFTLTTAQAMVGFAGFKKPNGTTYDSLAEVFNNECLPVDFTGWGVLFK